MSTALFPAFKFLALDYVYENIIKQRITTSWMYIPFPKGVQQNENYYHSGTFTSDNYRKPWKRISPLGNLLGLTSNVKASPDVNLLEVTNGTQLERPTRFKYMSEGVAWLMCPSLLTCTQKDTNCTPLMCPKKFNMQNTPCSTFVEKEECILDVVPSSNPSTQIDQEEILLFVENDVEEVGHISEECWRTSVPMGKKPDDYFIPDDLVFDYHIAKYGCHLPSLAVLRSRLKTIPVEDPLANWHKGFCTKEHLFRMDISKETETDSDFITEEFRVQPPKEQYLMLPCPLDVTDHNRVSRTSVSELITMLQITPDTIQHSPAEGQMVKTDSITKSTGKIDVLEHSYIKKDLDPIFEDTVCCKSYHEAELEIPLTPPNSLLKFQAQALCVNLATEEMSPAPQKIQIALAQEDILESRACTSDVHHLLLKVPQIPNTFRHATISELKKKISITAEKSVGFTLGNSWWGELGLNMKAVDILEPLTTDVYNANNLIINTMEDFAIITAVQLERLLEETTLSMKQKGGLQNSGQGFLPNACTSPTPKLSCPPSQSELLVDSKDASVSEMCEDSGKDERAHCDNLHTFSSYSEDVNVGKNSPFSLSHLNPTKSYSKEIHNGSNGHKIGSKDASDLLSSFIMLRTNRALSPNDILTEGLPLQESQCQAYRILEASAIPVLNKLQSLGISTCLNWKFGTVAFDCSRFLLRQREKLVTDEAKAGNEDDKDVMLFKHAALFHILVTLRDLILMCDFDMALEYLHEAKDMYKSLLGSSLDDMYRKLEIVQFVKEKNEELNPKILVLQSQLSQWMERQQMGEKQFKVIIITRMDSDNVKTVIIDGLCEIKGMKVTSLYPTYGRRILDSKEVLESLKMCTCIIINNQHIGNDFPWTHFCLVIEYDCTDCWLNLCQAIKVPHMTLKTCLPKAFLVGKFSFSQILLKMQIPYIFICSEGFLNNTEILKMMESRYGITFIERSCSASLQLFGKHDHCALITVDESTSIIMQDIDELKYEKTSENLILKLVALSLQYSCCWILLFSKAIHHSEYIFSENTLHSLALIYAAMVPLTSKSAELDVKVIVTSGLEKTGLILRQIADYTLRSCKSTPSGWLDRSWLSVLTSEAEQRLLAFPCINPMVAQLMLHRGCSLQWVLSASKDQLQELFPEVPAKVLKHFSDITSLHQLSTSASPPVASDITQSHRKDYCYDPYNIHAQNSSPGRHEHTSSSLLLCGKPQYGVLSPKLLGYVSPLRATEAVDFGISSSLHCYHGENSEFKPIQYMMHGQKDTFRNNTEVFRETDQMCLTSTSLDKPAGTIIPSAGSGFHNNFCTFLDCFNQPCKTHDCVNDFEQQSHDSVCLMDNLSGSVSSNKEDDTLHDICHQHFNGYCGRSVTQRNSYFTDSLNHRSPETPLYFPDQLRDVACVKQPVTSEKPQLLHPSPLKPGAFDFTPFLNTNNDFLGNPDFYQQSVRSFDKAGVTMQNNILNDNEEIKGLQFAQLPQPKRRKLSFEKVPGRRDGQTRLKFF
ncbi:protein shortage in chiasmata 1 ortholog [Spea bombifrons]|uniref:protein shortage in chiasmata 1 ortholog n=1 Tax=Spea bombifrons TaxID=233779 RepID=UPI0023493B85|nr:protein shortage in chiasmata 1 ortholog [Spea bombifrons]